MNLAELRRAADNVEQTRMSGEAQNLAGWEHRKIREAATQLEAMQAEIDRLRTLLERAIGLIEDAEKDTDWCGGDPYGDSASEQLRASLNQVEG